jgi:hypothetical protein
VASCHRRQTQKRSYQDEAAEGLGALSGSKRGDSAAEPSKNTGAVPFWISASRALPAAVRVDGSLGAPKRGP